MQKACEVCGVKFSVKPSHFDIRKTCSRGCIAKIKSQDFLRNNPSKTEAGKQRLRNRFITKETREKLRNLRLSKPCSEVTKIKLSAYWTGKARPLRRGVNCNLWKGGKSTESMKIKSSLEYKKFIKTCYARDSFTCRKCNVYRSNAKLNVHHILNFAEHHSSRTLVANGITLCLDCHKNFHKQFGKKNNNYSQLKQFLNPYGLRQKGFS